MADLAVGTVEGGYRYVGGDPGAPSSWEPEGLKIGAVDSGYRFKGGDPSSKDSWELDREKTLWEGARDAVKSVAGKVSDEAGRLRDELFTGVDNTKAALSTVNTTAQMAELQKSRDKLKGMEDSGLGGSPEAAGLRKTIDVYSARLPKMAGDTAEAQADARRGAQMTTRPAVQKLNEAKTWGDAWSAFKESPYDVIAGVTATSLPTRLPALVTGAVLGPAAGAAAMGLSSAATEAGSSLADYANDHGVNTTDPQALQAFFSDRQNLADAMSYAGKRAGIIGALDAASGGVAGKTLAPAFKSQLARQAVNMPAQMAVQAGLGAGGEAGGQLATKGKIDQPGQVLAEAVGELGGAPAEVLSFSQDARAALRPQALPAQVLTAPDVDTAIHAAQQTLALPAPGTNTGETLLATQSGVAGTASQFDVLRRPTDIRETGLMGQGRDSEITDVVPRESAEPDLGVPDASNPVGVEPSLQPGVSGRSIDAGGSELAGGLGDSGRGPAAEPGRSGGEVVSLGDGSEGPAAVDQRLIPLSKRNLGGTTANPGEPSATWFGRRGDGYLTIGDATMALPSRQKGAPDLNWTVERMPSGKFRLAGYAPVNVKSSDASTRTEATQTTSEAAAGGLRQGVPVSARSAGAGDRVGGDVQVRPVSQAQAQVPAEGAPPALADQRQANATDLPLTQTPPLSGVSISVTRNPSGTLAVTGDAQQIAKVLEAGGVTRMLPAKNGVLVSKQEADRAAKVLSAMTPKAPAETSAKPLSVGITALHAEPVTVKNGIVHIGEAEAINFDSGEPITVADGAGDEAVKQALTDGGALSKRQKFFGGDGKKAETISAFPKTAESAASGGLTTEFQRAWRSEIDRMVFKDIVSQSVQKDGQKVLNAMKAGDVETLVAIQQKYLRDAGLAQGGGGAGPGKEKTARRGAVTVHNAAEQALARLRKESPAPAPEQPPASAKPKGEGVAAPEAVKAPEAATQPASLEVGTGPQSAERKAGATQPSQASAVAESSAQDSSSASGKASSVGAKTIRDMLKEAGTKGFWLGEIVRNDDGERFDVKVIPWPSANMADWGYEFWQDGKKAQGIPFPHLKGATTVAQLSDILTDYMNADEPGAFTMDKIGEKHAGLIAQREGADRRKTDAEANAMRKARGDLEARAWDDTDLADYRRLTKLREARFKTAGDEKMIGLLEQRLKGRPDKWKVGDGASYKVTAGGAGMQTNRGFRVIALDPATKTATLRSVADTGLTSSGGNNDRIGDVTLPVGELSRERKYDTPAAPATEAAAPGKSEPMFSRAQPDTAFAAEVMNELAALDENFRHPVSKASSLSEVLADIDPTISEVGDATRPDEATESGADTRTLYRTGAGKDFYVYEKGRKVWIDVSRGKRWQGGDAIYSAVANYARNTGKQFVGDPAGLSEDAIIRRTYHMLGSALRFGSTAHFAPAPEQIEGVAAKGIAPLEWTGNDGDKLQSLVKSFTETVFNRNPALRDYRYDFDRGTFVDGRGNAVTREELLDVASRGGSEASVVGGRAAAAGVLLDSLARAPSGQRPRLLALVHQRPGQLLDSLGGPLFKRGSTSGTLRVSQIREALAPALAALKIPYQLHPTVEAAREAFGGQYVPSGAKGAYFRGKLHLIADGLHSELEAEEVFWHEVNHAGLDEMYGAGSKDYESALRALVWQNKNIRQAAKEWMDKYGDEDIAIRISNGAAPEKARLRAQLQAIDEALAEMGGRNAQIKGLVRFIAKVQEFMRAIGLNRLADALEGKTDAQALSMILGARDAVMGGRRSAQGFASVAPAFSKEQESEFARGDQTLTEAFKKWFAGSKVVDAEGKPRVVYHGAPDARFIKEDGTFKSHKERLFGKYDPERAFFFTSDERVAKTYADPRRAFDYQNAEEGVIPAYLSLQNPLEIDHKGGHWRGTAAAMEAARAAGHDGVIIRNVLDDYNNVKGGSKTTTVYVAFHPEQIKSATGNNGNFDASNPNISFSRATMAGQTAQPDESGVKSVMTGQPLADTWQAPDKSKLDNIIYSLQDKHVDTRRVVQAVRSAIGSIADNLDPYLQEELYHGRAAMATKEFLEKSLRPLLGELRSRGIDISDFEEYLHNRHAPRRNEQIAKINPKYNPAAKEFIGTEGSGINTADAQAYMAALPPAKKSAFESLAKHVDQINKETRALLVSSGLEKQSTIDAWQGAYGDEYVPLMREEMDNGTTGLGQGFNVRGGSSKRALGSNKPVANILANIALQREKAITRAEKRKVGEAVYGMALKAPKEDFWFAVDPKLQQNPQQVLATAVQLISMGLDPQDAESIAREPSQRYVDPRTGLVSNRVNPALRSAENVLAVRIDGEDKYVFFNSGDPRAMRMVKALKNLDADQLGAVMGTVAKMTRYFSAINTQLNPVFGVTNITRDIQTALLNLNSTPLKNHKADVMKHILPALRGIYIDLRDHRAGKQPTSAYAGLFEEFQREGGATGYRDMYANAGERAEAIAKELRAIKDGTAVKLGKAIMGWLSDYNESMENAVRVAAYKVAKEQGMSNQQAASLAKNLTVNFNRKGQVALQAGALYAFFNASVQGSARMAQTMFTMAEPGKFKTTRLSGVGKKIISGGLLLGSMQAMLFALAGYDDDEPPEFVRQRNLIIPNPFNPKQYATIPMPLGFHIIPNLGRIPTEWAMSGFKKTPQRLAGLVALFIDGFNPIGSGTALQALAPTVVDPLAALAENKDWTGKSIARQDFDSLKPTAGHTRAKDTATPWARMIAYSVNYLTGGTDYKPGIASPTPDQVDYLIGQVSGGIGREVGKLAQVGSSTMSGEELPLYKIPLVGRFVGTTEGQAAEASRFYDNLKEIGQHKVEIDGLRKDHRGSEISAYIRENREALLVPMADRVQRDVSKLHTLKRDLIKRDAPKERVKEIDDQITARMAILNKRVREVSATSARAAP